MGAASPRARRSRRSRVNASNACVGRRAERERGRRPIGLGDPVDVVERVPERARLVGRQRRVAERRRQRRDLEQVGAHRGVGERPEGQRVEAGGPRLLRGHRGVAADVGEAGGERLPGAGALGIGIGRRLHQAHQLARPQAQLQASLAGRRQRQDPAGGGHRGARPRRRRPLVVLVPHPEDRRQLRVDRVAGAVDPRQLLARPSRAAPR